MNDANLTDLLYHPPPPLVDKEDGDDDRDHDGEEEREHDRGVPEDEAAVVGVDDELGSDGRAEERQRREVVLLHSGPGGVVRRDAQSVSGLGTQVENGEGGRLLPPVARNLDKRFVLIKDGNQIKFSSIRD